MSIKDLIFSKTYLHLYPMADKGKEICDKINNCDLDEKSQLADDKRQLYNFIISDQSIIKIETDNTERQLNRCYRTKKVKIKDEETNRKVVEKVKVKRRGVIGLNININNYNKEIDAQKGEADKLVALASSLADGSLAEYQLTLCDKVLKNNRINPFIYRIGLGIIVVIILMAILLNIM